MSGDGDAEEFGMYQEPVVAELEPEQVVRPKIRIGLKELLEDHFNIVQLYKMTEDIFGWQLIIYYFIQARTFKDQVIIRCVWFQPNLWFPFRI